MKKLIVGMVTVAMVTMLFAGCGPKSNDAGSNLEGTCAEILEQVYADAELSGEVRDAMANYQNIPIDEASEEYILGTTEVNYTDSVYSAPMMSSIAYQCVVLRLDDSQDVETAKTLLKDNANPIKWICVEAESVIVENVGNVVLYVMADTDTATAIQGAFLNLNK